MATHTLQEGQLLEEQGNINFEGVELVHHVNQVGEPVILPVLVLVPTFCQCQQLLLVRHLGGLLCQQLEELGSGGRGDVQVVGERFTEGDGDRQPSFLTPGRQPTETGFPAALHVDRVIRIARKCEPIQKLADQFGIVLRVNGNMVPRYIVQPRTLGVQYHQNC